MNFYEIDGMKLRNELKKRGYDLQGASLEIGYSKAYINTLISKEKAPERAINLIDTVLGIPYEEIKPQPQKPQYDKDELYNIIFTAVRNGMDAVLDSGRLNSDIYTAIIGAQKRAEYGKETN